MTSTSDIAPLRYRPILPAAAAGQVLALDPLQGFTSELTSEPTLAPPPATEPGSDGWRGLRTAPLDNRGFVEQRSYAFELPGPGWSLRIDDEPIETQAPGGGVVWTPGFYAGEVTAEVLQPDGRTAALVLLDVSPHPDKVGRDVYLRMIEELWQADPSLIAGAEPATSAVGDRGDAVRNPWLAFARLRRHAPAFLRALAIVQSRPRQGLRPRRTEMPLHQVRRVDAYTTANMVRIPAVARALFAPHAATAADTSRRIDVAHVEETMDIAANRTLAVLVRAALRRAKALIAVLGEEVERERGSETQTPLASRWPARKAFLADFAMAVSNALRRPPFVHLRRVEITSAGLTAIAAEPRYAHAWKCGWRALRDGVESERRDERLWMSPTWQIYERWCFVRLSSQVQFKLTDWTWRRERASSGVQARLIGRSPTGRHAVELWLQPTFRSRQAPVDGPWSISMQREPDIVLIAHDPEATEATRFVVLDAKYRQTRQNVLDAMSSAHIYHDSLRIGAARALASLLLVPSGGGAKWLESPEFQREHRVGIHPFSADEEAVLPWVLQDLLEACSRMAEP